MEKTPTQQLDDVISQCIEKGWKGIYECFFVSTPQGLDVIGVDYKHTFSYHWLFSRDSGLMDYVDWKDMTHELALNVREKSYGLDCDCSWSGLSSDKRCRADYHYMMMGPMTANQKVLYFLENIVISSD